MSGVELGEAVRVLGLPVVELAAGSHIAVGPRSVLISRSRPTALGVSRPVILRTLRTGARIEIGADVGLSGTTICAARLVSVGDRVLFGADVLVADTDFHVIDSLPRRYAPPPEPQARDRVLIGADVFIGARTIVLSGSTIGEGSVIGAGSVVKGEIPPGVVAAGNPCRVIRPLSAPNS
jgi:acetyltransferase-like isoleucine patch superfamily enzyme